MSESTRLDKVSDLRAKTASVIATSTRRSFRLNILAGAAMPRLYQRKVHLHVLKVYSFLRVQRPA